MKLDTFFTWFKKKSRRQQTKAHLDRKLVGAVNSRSIPSFTQLKYVGRFLEPQEKKLVAILGIVSAATALGLAAVFLFTHFTPVARQGGDYSEAMVGQPKFVNPIYASASDIDSDLSSLTYTGLFHYVGSQLEPDLATTSTLSSDKKIYTITLKTGVQWSDGNPLTVDDVLFTFETIQNPEASSPLLPAFQGVQIEKVDDKTIRFTLKEPFAPFLNSLTVGILPEHIWAAIPPLNLKLTPLNLKPIGTGPWKFKTLIKDDSGTIQSYVLSPNELYYGKKPYLQTLTFKFFADPNEAVDAVQNQSVSAISFVPSKSQDKLSSKNLVSHPLILPQYTALFFNQERNATLKDADARKALSLAINKQSIVDTALEGAGQVLDAPLLPGSIGYYPDIKKIGFDVDAANALLDKKWTRIQPEEYFSLRQAALLKAAQPQIDAAIKNPPEGSTASSTIDAITAQVTEKARAEMSADQTFYRKTKDGTPLTISITFVDTKEYEKTAALLADQWKALGIKTIFDEVSSRTISKDVFKNRSFDILLYGEIIGGDPDLFPFWHSSQADYPGLNLAQFSDRTADKLLEDARATTDTAARETFYKKFQDILVDQVPAVFLFTPNYNFFVNKNIKGITANRIVAPSDRYASLSDWYVKTSWKWKTE